MLDNQSSPRDADDGPGHALPDVTVIIPVHGDRGEIAATARHLAGQVYPGTFSVIVADNGDNLGLENSLKPLGDRVSIVEESAPGSYAARNAALRQVTTEVLAFTDGDCLPRPDWLHQGVLALLETSGPSFVGGAIELFPQDPTSPTLAELWDGANGLRQDHYVLDQGWAATANMFTLRRTMQQVGTFDAALKSGGDREWGLRATARGAKPIFSQRAVVDHPARPTMSELHLKVRRVTSGDIDRRRSAGLPALGSGWSATLRPNTRSILRKSAEINHRTRSDQVRYVLVAHWMQYYFLLSRLRYARQIRRAST